MRNFGSLISTLEVMSEAPSSASWNKVGGKSRFLPATLGIRFHQTVYAEMASRVEGVVRTADLEATITHDDPLELFATFITMVMLCRGFVE